MTALAVVAGDTTAQRVDAAAETILSGFLSLSVEPLDEAEFEGDLVTAVVQFVGAGTGSVLLQADHYGAAYCAAIMFGFAVDDMQPADVDDAWGEICNMLGGEFLPALPSPTTLAPPIVVRGGQLAIHGAKQLARRHFAVGDIDITIILQSHVPIDSLHEEEAQ